MADMKKYRRSFSFSSSASDGSPGSSSALTAYEDENGDIYAVSDGSLWTPPGSGGGGGGSVVWPLNVKEDRFEEFPLVKYQGNYIPVNEAVGKYFPVPKRYFGNTVFGNDYIWPDVTYRCTGADISDEVASSEPGNIARFWKITLTGTTAGVAANPGDGSITVKRLGVTLVSELNGSLERSISGRAVVLRRSAEPIARLSIEAAGRVFPCPKVPGDPFTFFLLPGVEMAITSVTTKRNVQEGAQGAVAAELYDYSIEAEA
jgi:hypothetical protein